MSALLLAAALCLAPQESVAGVPYERLETREATRARMEELLAPPKARWGEWHRIGPFAYAGHGKGDLATFQGPEAELSRLRAGGAGPDLAATYPGKKGARVPWTPIGAAVDRPVDLHGDAEDPELRDNVSCYLYAPLVAERARAIEVTAGSDDGMRFWLNGRLLVDRDVPRGLDPEAERMTLELEEGVNHVLVKVVDGVGGFDFQINTRKPLPGRVDAELDYLLDRDFPPSPERAHYRVLSYPVPDDVVLEVGGLAVLSDGRPVVTTRRGDVFVVEDAYGEPPLDARFELFAEGLHEPLGAAARLDDDGEAVYAVQRGELTRLVDEDGDGRADLYETFCDGWGVSGNYHEFAFGPKLDRDGNAWVTLNVGFCGSLGKSVVPWRGWAVKITPAGRLEPVCDGLRSPNGIGMWTDGEMFYLDNQGDYVATNRLSHLAPGSFHGHPAGLRWRRGRAKDDPPPPRQPASVWFPYRKMGQSAADLALDETRGRFGPFAGQFFVGDQTAATVMRVTLEQVDGHYQGACYPFLEELDCGVNRLCFLPDGSLLIGETDRGWGSVGRKRYGLERAVYTGRAPFEILAMRARPDGFELELTQDVDPTSAEDPASYRLVSYTYEYHPDYGAPEEDELELELLEATLAGPRTVHLRVAPLRAGYVHELHAPGLRSVRWTVEGEPEALLHDEAYYTLIRVPRGDGPR